MESPHKGPVMWKAFWCHWAVITYSIHSNITIQLLNADKVKSLLTQPINPKYSQLTFMGKICSALQWIELWSIWKSIISILSFQNPQNAWCWMYSAYLQLMKFWFEIVFDKFWHNHMQITEISHHGNYSLVLILFHDTTTWWIFGLNSQNKHFPFSSLGVLWYWKESWV